MGWDRGAGQAAIDFAGKIGREKVVMEGRVANGQ